MLVLRWRLLLYTTLFAGSAGSTLAVTPLVTDDADPANFRDVEMDSVWIFSRTDSLSLHELIFTPMLGVIPNAEIGFEFGYQWRDGNSREFARANGMTDLTLQSKYRFWQTTDERFKLGASLKVKLPTASENKNLGSGKPDASVLLLFTHRYGKLYLDSNLGYKLVDLSHRRSADDELFIGQALRQELAPRWWLIGEVVANIPLSAHESRSEFDFNLGVIFTLNDKVTFSNLIGTAAGHDSPDLTSSLAVTVVF